MGEKKEMPRPENEKYFAEAVQLFRKLPPDERRNVCKYLSGYVDALTAMDLMQPERPAS